MRLVRFTVMATFVAAVVVLVAYLDALARTIR